MKKFSNHFSFLAIGKTEESKDASEGFKRYIGLASSYVVAVNPTKKQLSEIYGREVENEPEYILEDEKRGKGFKIDFIVKTDPESNNGIEIINHATFRLFPAAYYNRDESKVRVIDNYGNSIWMLAEDAKAGKAPLTSAGEPARIDTKYRMAFVGEPELIDFLRKFLFNKDSFRMINSTWTKQADAEDVKIYFDNVKALLGGDISEVKEAIALQPNNKIKLLYGVKTTDEGKQYQAVCTSYDMMLRNNSGANALPGLEKNLASAKNSGMYSNIDYRVQELQEYDVQPTNLDKAQTDKAEEGSSEMPWD